MQQEPTPFEMASSERALSVSTPTPEVPPPRPCFPVVSFGVGGKLVVMFPQVSRHSGNATAFVNAMDNVESTISAVYVHSLANILSPQGDSDAMQNGFPGPLSVEASSRSAIMGYASQMADKTEAASLEQQVADDPVARRHLSSRGTLWRLLALLCKHTGAVSSRHQTSQAENTDPITTDIAALLAGAAADGRSGGETNEPQIHDEMVGEVRLAALAEVRSLLVEGRKADACESAAGAGLWEHALVLGQQIGADCYKKMLQR